MVSVASFVQHQRTAATLRLLHEGYLPLALTVGEVRAMQTVFDTLLERVLFEHDIRGTRSWFDVARRSRPKIVEEALQGIEKIEDITPPSLQSKQVAELRRELMRVESAPESGDERYDTLFE